MVTHIPIPDDRYDGANPTNGEAAVEVVESAAALLRRTVEVLSRHTPSIVAAAARELGAESVGFHFADQSRAELRAKFDTLRVVEPEGNASVECTFSDRSLERLFDLDQRPKDTLDQDEMDARGKPEAILAVWRTFRILSQRAAGLRIIQRLWSAYRHTRGMGAASGPTVKPAPDGTWRRHEVPDAAALLRGTELGAARSASVATSRALWDGRSGQGWWSVPGPRDADLHEVLQGCMQRAMAEIDAYLPHDGPPGLYDLMRDYPRRGGKGLRPTLAMATCGAFGGQSEDAVRISAAIEMFHNGFLIHDDIEDESEFRRGIGCLHTLHGVPLAVNAGDGMNLLAVDAVLSNIERLGLARTLALMHEVIHMCRLTMEGQAIELSWIRNHEVPPGDEDYFEMVTRKTGWYTCMSPCRLGAIAAGHTRPHELDLLASVFHKVGIAFQIQDDLLNLLGKEEQYGKESLGDLLEGKRTLMLIHLARNLAGSDRAELMEWLALSRREKTQSEAEWALGLMEREGSLEYGRSVSAKYAHLGTELFESELAFLPETEPKAVLRQVVHYVTTREL